MGLCLMCFKQYCLCLCNKKETINYAQATSKGSTMPYAVWDGALADMITLIPEHEVLESFNKIVYPILSKIKDSCHERLRLINLRDTLLPNLMSGEIDVDEVEI